MSSSKALEKLRAMQRKPALYLGDRENLFTKVIAFIHGFTDGHFAAASRVPTKEWEFLPEDFHRFVAVHFHARYPDSAEGWATHIRKHTRSEQEAFDVFIRLREEFEIQRTRDEPNA